MKGESVVNTDVIQINSQSPLVVESCIVLMMFRKDRGGPVVTCFGLKLLNNAINVV